MHIISLLADSSDSVGGAMGGLVVQMIVAYAIVTIPLFGVFTKAGESGWTAFVPVYNTIILLKLVGRPVWWIVLFLVPGVGLVVWIFVSKDLAKSFGETTLFALGLFLLMPIFLFILWLGPARYMGPSPQPIQLGGRTF